MNRMNIDSQSAPPRPVRVAVVGDLLLPTDPLGVRPDRDPERMFARIAGELASCDVAIGNLECTLPGDGRTVPTEPRVIASEPLVRGVGRAGLTVVTLANNHTFDCHEPGFHRLRDLLGELGIAWCGAGDDLDEALAPAVVEAGGVRLAILSAADRRSGTTDFAAPGRPGVAPLELERLTGQVRRLAGQVDSVIVSPHWGDERFAIPAPEQVEAGRALIDAGAALVVGHHPHVVQGMERYGGGAIAYSLGNFVASEVPFTDGDAVRWGRLGRTGCLLRAELAGGRLANIEQVPTYDDGEVIDLDRTGRGRRLIDRRNAALTRPVTLRRYRREHFRVNTIKPALAYLRWSRLKTLRPGHLKKALASAMGASRAR
jgi:poly-gamma-glutamate synthesis protein (capsule biosynthesis protein)